MALGKGKKGQFVKSSINLVKEFMVKFGRPVASNINITDASVNIRRLDLLVEEIKELNKALLDSDSVAVLDALTDIQYILDGSYLEFGLAEFKDKAFDIVHKCNMKKLDKDGKPILREDGKILKPEGWVGPEKELERLLDEA